MHRRWMVCGAALVLMGCGVQAAREAARSVRSANPEKQTAPGLAAMQAEEDPSAPRPPADVERRIIYEAAVQLVVSDFADAESAIPRLVKEHGGYLADVSIDRTSGEQRSGRWQVRIPVDRFDSFLDVVSKLGVSENRRQTAQDVTEEYVDLEAQIANKKRLEERILKLLEDSRGEIKDVIEVERELARVRGEIEQMEGRLRYLTNRTEFTTVTVFVREERDYVPPEAPTFLTRIRQAWQNSLIALKNFAANAAVALVFAFPWLFVLAAFFAPALWYWRRRKASYQKRAP